MTAIRRRLSAIRKRHAGFSLVEMMIALSLLMIVTGLAFSELSTGMTQTAQLDRASTSSTTARLAIDQIITELRQASTNDINVKPVAVSTASTLTFYSPDRSAAKRLRKITYRVNAGVLERSELLSINTGAAPWTFPATTPTFRVMLRDVTNTDIFSYLDDFEVATTVAANVRSLNINLVVKGSLRANSERIYRTGITIRSSV